MGSVYSIICRLVSTIIVTRILTPEDYGIAGPAFVIMYVLSMLLDTGIKASIITSDNTNDSEFIATCWTVQILRGAIISFLLIFIAFIIRYLQNTGFFSSGTAFENSNLFIIIILISIKTFIDGFLSVNVYVYDKNIILKPYIVMNLFVDTLVVILNISLAIVLRSFYALIISSIASSLLRIGLSYILFQGFKMYFKLNASCLKEILERGRWIAANSTLNMISSSADRFLLGNYLQTNEFGIYIIAKQIAEPVLKLLTSPHSSYGLQIAKQSVEKNNWRNYFNYRLIFLFLGVVTCVFSIFFSEKIVKVVYDDRYLNSYMYINIIFTSALTIFFSMNRELLSYRGEFMPMAISTLIDGFVSILIGSIVLFYFKNPILYIYVFSISSIFSIPYIWFSLNKNSLPFSKYEIALLPVFASFLFLHYLILL